MEQGELSAENMVVVGEALMRLRQQLSAEAGYVTVAIDREPDEQAKAKNEVGLAVALLLATPGAEEALAAAYRRAAQRMVCCDG